MVLRFLVPCYTERMRNLSNNSIALAGEFAVLSQLTLYGYDANMTLGNTKSVDILVADPETGRMFKIEVKTHYRDNAYKSRMFGNTFDWMMSEKHETIVDPNLFYIFVNISSEQVFRFFVVPSSIVASYVREQHQYWLSTKTEESDTNLRRFRIGLENDGYPIDTPLAVDYESKWDFEPVL